MLLNSYEDAADILQYIPRRRGHHQWIFIDTDKVDIPEGSKTVSLWYDLEEDRAVDLESVNFFQEHVEVIGDEYIEYVRHPDWPENLFLNQEHFASDSTLIESNAQRDNWIVNIHDYTDPMYDRISISDIEGLSRTRAPSLALAPVECQATDRLAWYVRNDPSGPSFPHPYPGDEQMSQIHMAGPDFGLALNRWIYFDAQSAAYAHLHRQHAGIVHVSNSLDGDYDCNTEEYRHYAHLETASIPYFRRPWWPQGVWRLAELYYVDDVNRDSPALIPVFDDEPTPSECAAFRAAHIYESGQLVGGQYRSRCNLQRMLENARGSEFEGHDHELDPHRWVRLVGNGEVKEAGKREATLSFRLSSYAIDDYSLAYGVEHREPMFGASPQLYRYERWPHHVWSTVWNNDEVGDKVPAYGPDAFGNTCSYEDNSTPTNPIDLEGEFSYQKWVIPSWDPLIVTTRGEGVMSVGFSEGRYVSRLRSSYDAYHLNSWTESRQQYGASYFRRASFPPGLWRRVDCFKDANSEGGPMQMEVLPHDDEPGGADVPAPWYSSYLENWVRSIESKTGRAISHRTDGDAPWLKFWTPSESDASSSSITARIGGHRIVLPIGELPRVRGHSRGSNILDDDRNFHIARRYRSGVALAFNPCGVRYEGEAPDGEERPHPLKLILDQIEEFYLEYHDPDVVEDLVDDMYERVKIKVQGFTDIIKREQLSVRTMQQNMIVSAQKINDLLGKRGYYDSMSKGRFRRSLEVHRNLVTNLGTLRLDGDNLILRMHEFHIDEQPIGPLNILIDISGRSLPLFVTTEDNASQYENAHPHVDTDGRVCWGNGSDIAAQMAVGADPLEYMFWAANVLRDGYQAHDAYCTIENWIHKNVWWCEHCEAEHPNDTECPNYCSHCDSHVDMDEHSRCSRHGCWNEYDSEGGECPACEEAAQEEQDRIDQEAEEEEERKREEEEAAQEAVEELERVRLEEEDQRRLASQPEGQQEPQQPPGEESAAE